VELAAAAIIADANGVKDASGKQHHPDLLVLATGFKAADYLARIRVKGSNGIEIHDFWNGEPTAYLGSCVPGFPNFFMMYGPNSNAGPVIFMIECQAKFAVDSIVDMKRRRARKVEVTKTAFNRFNVWVQARLETSVFKSTKNYYASDSGKIVTQWPFSATRFWWISRIERRRAMKLSKPF
jgi:cyclohexanone monooxygenase